MNQSATWFDWVEFHSTFFGWRDDKDRKMLISWAKFFDDESYGPEELMEATRRIPKGDPKAAPFKREDHIHHLISAVKIYRESFRTIPKSEQAFNCKLCTSSGLVRVPRLKDVVNYSWRTKYAVYVSCSCINGAMFRNSKSNKPMMTLAEYETKNFDWKNQIRMAEETEKKLNDMLTKNKPATHLDDVISKIMRRYSIAPKETA
jgi:hypothetical protein